MNINDEVSRMSFEFSSAVGDHVQKSGEPQ